MKRVWRLSIFAKLLVAYGVAFVILIVGFSLARVLSASLPNVEVSTENLLEYARYLAQDMGYPPQPALADQIAARTGVEIALFGPGLEWASNDEVLVKFREWSRHSGFFRPLDADTDCLVVLQKGEYRFVFSEFHADHRMTVLLWILMAGMIMLALSLSYLLVRHFLRPLRDMDKVAREFGVQDWKARVNPRGHDELAHLGRAMDGMADRIEGHVSGMHELVTAISHELRSPLTRMKLSLEFLEDSRIRQSLKEEIDSLDRLTGDLLEQKRLESPGFALTRQAVELQSWIREASKVYVMGESGCDLRIRGPEKTVFIDQGRMDLVLRNLVENALRHAPGSPVHLSLDTAGGDGCLWYLEVQDEGSGMEDELIRRIGEPFLLADRSRSGKRSGSGFGLGLSIVSSIVKAHGAHLEVRNAAPQGLCIRISFPKTEQA